MFYLKRRNWAAASNQHRPTNSFLSGHALHSEGVSSGVLEFVGFLYVLWSIDFRLYPSRCMWFVIWGLVIFLFVNDD